MTSPLTLPRRLAIRPLRPVALGLLCLGVPGFVALAWLVSTQGHLNGLDVRAAEWARQLRSPALTQILLIITHLHSVMAISAYTAGLSVWLMFKREHRHWLLPLWLFVPAGAKPAGGWPVAIFGHGFTDSMYGAPWTVASVLASQGIATVSINVVGHGGGPLGTLNVLPSAAAPVVVPAGGRGMDQDGNGNIDATEGVNAAAPRSIISSRDGLRQTVIDLMQLVRQIEAGVDVDGDGAVDLNPQRIYYAGQSFGGIYGTILLGVEPNIQAGVPNVPGGSITEVARLGVFRPLTGVALATRVPSLINVADPSGIVFNENIPLRNLPPVVNSVPGAAAIQQVLDRFEWVQQAGNPVSYASLIRKKPLRGNAPKSVIVQVAKGDTVVPNPTSSAIVRAGELADRTTYFRNDLAYAANMQGPTVLPGREIKIRVESAFRKAGM